jgi:hypothetical protein
MFSSETSSNISQNQDSCGILEAAFSLSCCLWFELPGRVLDPVFFSFQPLKELTCKETKLVRLPSEILLISSWYLQQLRLLAEKIFYPLEQVGMAMMVMMVCLHISLHSGNTLDLFLLHLIAQSELVAQSQLLEYSQEKERRGALRRHLCLLTIFLLIRKN